MSKRASSLGSVADPRENNILEDSPFLNAISSALVNQESLDEFLENDN